MALLKSVHVRDSASNAREASTKRTCASSSFLAFSSRAAHTRDTLTDTLAQQAKTNFLDITAEMLDSTVHRTIVENQVR